MSVILLYQLYSIVTGLVSTKKLFDINQIEVTTSPWRLKKIGIKMRQVKSAQSRLTFSIQKTLEYRTRELSIQGRRSTACAFVNPLLNWQLVQIILFCFISETTKLKFGWRLLHVAPSPSPCLVIPLINRWIDGCTAMEGKSVVRNYLTRKLELLTAVIKNCLLITSDYLNCHISL
jgi:hypothetical protein